MHDITTSSASYTPTAPPTDDKIKTMSVSVRPMARFLSRASSSYRQEPAKTHPAPPQRNFTVGDPYAPLQLHPPSSPKPSSQSKKRSARFEKILRPISKVLLKKEEKKYRKGSASSSRSPKKTILPLCQDDPFQSDFTYVSADISEIEYLRRMQSQKRFPGLVDDGPDE